MKRVAGMPPGVVLEKLLRRATKYVDVPLSTIELRNHGIKTERKVSYQNRKVLRELRHCLSHGTELIVYDIGGHTGRYAAAIAAASAVRQVVSFEPIRESFQELVDRTRDSGKVRAINLALGDERGEAEFQVNEAPGSSSFLEMLPSHVEHFPQTAMSSSLKVQVSKLDDVVAECRLTQPDIIKMDVQGYEDRVIAGGLETFQAATWCLIELSLVDLYEGAMTFDQLYRKVVSLGFRLCEVTDQLKGKDGTTLQMNALFERQ